MSYDEAPIKKEGIDVQELIFPDGQVPDMNIIRQWLETVDKFFGEEGPKKSGQGEGHSGKHDEEKRIGVHCVAGLGRAPFLVAIALVNAGCSPVNAIDLIRKHRSGAFNHDQAGFIIDFKPMKRKSGSSKGCECAIF